MLLLCIINGAFSDILHWPPLSSLGIFLINKQFPDDRTGAQAVGPYRWAETGRAAQLSTVQRCLSTSGVPASYWGQELYRNPFSRLALSVPPWGGSFNPAVRVLHDGCEEPEEELFFCWVLHHIRLQVEPISIELTFSPSQGFFGADVRTDPGAGTRLEP